jgi:hypothetical protein
MNFPHTTVLSAGRGCAGYGCPFLEELKKTEITVLATANNNEGDDVWAIRIRDQKAKILRDFKKLERPCFSVIQRSGNITNTILRSSMTTRRSRPREHEAEPRAEHGDMAMKAHPAPASPRAQGIGSAATTPPTRSSAPQPGRSSARGNAWRS